MTKERDKYQYRIKEELYNNGDSLFIAQYLSERNNWLSVSSDIGESTKELAMNLIVKHRCLEEDLIKEIIHDVN